MESKQKKGTIGAANLPISKKYLFPAGRRLPQFLGGLAMILILSAALYDIRSGKGRFLSNGPLSSAHASFEDRCDSCHTEAASVVADACSACHEKTGDELGVFTYASHYLYNSGDFRRVSTHDHEVPCTECHTEHQGRKGRLRQVPDQPCLRCHNFGSFNEDHPQFDAIAQRDPQYLNFPHGRHVRELVKEKGFKDLEQACLYCHQATEDGRQFQPLNFDAQCDACHLTLTAKTGRLPLAESDKIGVLSLQSIQEHYPNEHLWSSYLNPNEFKLLGGRFISKGPLYHKDPWVLFNLRRLRRMLYPDAGLADLLTSGTQVASTQLIDLYREAVAQLEAQALSLRAQPEPAIQKELAQIQDALTMIHKRLDNPFTILDETAFLLAMEQENSHLSPEQREEIHLLADELTKECRRCHTMNHLTLARVQKDQQTYRRAHFDHGAHVLQRGCLDCHNRFPEGIFDPVPEDNGPEQKRPDDLSSLQNLPGIEACRQCHLPDKVSNDCTTCHLFHPNTSKRSHLLRYIEGGPP